MAKAMGSSKRSTIALGLIAATIGIIAAILWSYLPLSDAAAYFNFADQKIVFGIPHFFDVSSNIFFIYISFFSMIIGFKKRYYLEQRVFESFFIMNFFIFLTGCGSSYFHLFPRPENLFWDRLPIALGFASLLSLVLVDRVINAYHRALIVFLNSLAFWSVWRIYYGHQDIRAYLVIQFGSMLAVLCLLVVFPRGHVRKFYLGLALLLYAAAKYSEVYDHEFYTATQSAISGHTLKHLLAALSVLVLNFGVLRSSTKHAGT